MATLVKRNSTLFPASVSDFFNTDIFNFNNDFFRLTTNLTPSVNVSETDKEFKIELAAPGLEKKDFKLSVENGILTVSSEKQSEKTEEKKNYWRKEFSYNQFSRSFQLPENSVSEKLDAKYDNGILNIIVPKKEVTASNPKKEFKVS
jgi:HSP20 family protein